MAYVAMMMAFIAAVIVLGVGAWYLDTKEREESLVRESLETSRLLEDSLNQRLEDLDEYRHDLAALLQELDFKAVLAAEEDQSLRT